MQRGIRSALTSLALAAFGRACRDRIRASAAGGEPVKLGLIDIYGGGFAFIADSIRTGFQIAVDEANQAGGLNGRPFELVTADMGGSVEKAVTEARRMILEEKIKFVTVGIHSGAAVAVGNLGQEYKVLVIGGFATTSRLTGEAGHRYVGRANLSTVEIGRLMADHLKGGTRREARLRDRALTTSSASTSWPDFIAASEGRASRHCRSPAPRCTKLGATDFGRARHRLAGATGGSRGRRCVRGGPDQFPALGARLRSVRRQDAALHPRSRSRQDGTRSKSLVPPDTIGHRHGIRSMPSIRRSRRPFTAGIRKTHEDLSRRLRRRSATSLGKHAHRRRSASPVLDDVDGPCARRSAPWQFEGPTGPVKIRACDNMALYDFYVGTVKRAPDLPDGIGLADIKTYNTEPIARSCEDIMNVRGKG